MLSITLTKTAIHFNDLSDELYTAIKKQFPELTEGTRIRKPTHMIQGTPAELYKVLYDLSFTYDIEII